MPDPSIDSNDDIWIYSNKQHPDAAFIHILLLQGNDKEDLFNKCSHQFTCLVHQFTFNGQMPIYSNCILTHAMSTFWVAQSGMSIYKADASLQAMCLVVYQSDSHPQ